MQSSIAVQLDSILILLIRGLTAVSAPLEMMDVRPQPQGTLNRQVACFVDHHLDRPIHAIELLGLAKVNLGPVALPFGLATPQQMQLKKRFRLAGEKAPIAG